MIMLVNRIEPHIRFWVYFSLLEETTFQNFKERKTYIYTKIRVNTMKGWNMTVKMKIQKDSKKGMYKISWLEKEKKRENVIRLS